MGLDLSDGGIYPFDHIPIPEAQSHKESLPREIRKCVDAIKNDEEQANHMLEQIGKLYLLEAEMRYRALGWEKRMVLRNEHAGPVLENLGRWQEEKHYSYRLKSPMGQAIAYAHKRWAGLSAYVLHGQMEIDNNLVENAVRPMAVGRKAYLFVGSHQAAEMTAAMYSFMASCKKIKSTSLIGSKMCSKEYNHKSKKIFINYCH